MYGHFDHLRISNARKHDNSVWSIHTKNVNDDDDDELSMSFVICFEKKTACCGMYCLAIRT